MDFVVFRKKVRHIHLVGHSGAPPKHNHPIMVCNGMYISTYEVWSKWLHLTLLRECSLGVWKVHQTLCSNRPPQKAIPIIVYNVLTWSWFAQSCVHARGEIPDTPWDTIAIPICSKNWAQIDPLPLSFPPFLFLSSSFPLPMYIYIYTISQLYTVYVIISM